MRISAPEFVRRITSLYFSLFRKRFTGVVQVRMVEGVPQEIHVATPPQIYTPDALPRVTNR